jgi:hypothetical protein
MYVLASFPKREINPSPPFLAREEHANACCLIL